MAAPAGYKYVYLAISGLTNKVTTTVCLRCGCTVGDTTIHNNWHTGGTVTPTIEAQV